MKIRAVAFLIAESRRPSSKAPSLFQSSGDYGATAPTFRLNPEAIPKESRSTQGNFAADIFDVAD